MIFLRSHQTLELQCHQSAHPLVMGSSGCPREQNTLVTVMQGGFPCSTGKQEVPVASFLPSAQGPPSCLTDLSSCFLVECFPSCTAPTLAPGFSAHVRPSKGPQEPAPVEEQILAPQDRLLRPRDNPVFMKSPLNLKVLVCVGKIMATP